MFALLWLTLLTSPEATRQAYQDIGVLDAWKITQGRPEVIIAVIDGGVDITHPAFSGRVVNPYDAFDRDTDQRPSVHDPHGTQVAGIAVGAKPGHDVLGVCPRCSLMPIRAMSKGGGIRLKASKDAFIWAAEHGADIILAAWFPSRDVIAGGDLAEGLDFALEQSKGAGQRVTIFAAGNERRLLPRKHLVFDERLLTVSAVNAENRVPRYANRGRGLDLVAPGLHFTTGTRRQYTDRFGGTSAASAVVAGVVGLMLSANPKLTRKEIQSILKNTAKEVGEALYLGGHDDSYGYGRVDAYAAVKEALRRRKPKKKVSR